VHCLYCGKDIGALRILKDREFCSAAHRKDYKERLGRVLTQIASSNEPPPPPHAGFLLTLSPQAGNSSCAIELWRSGGNSYRVHTLEAWPVELPGLAHRRAKSLLSVGAQLAEAEPRPFIEWRRITAVRAFGLSPVTESLLEQGPPPCGRWFASSGPQPAELWLEYSVAECWPMGKQATLPEFCGLAPTAAPGFGAGLAPPDLYQNSAIAPGAEPAASFIRVSLAEALFARATIRTSIPLFVAVNTGLTPPDRCDTFAPAPAAEPVAHFVQALTARVLSPSAATLFLPAFDLTVATDLILPELRESVGTALPAMASEATHTSSAEPLSPAAAVLIPAAFAIAIDTNFTPPDLWQALAPAPLAEPVASFLAASSADQIAGSLPIAPALRFDIRAELEPLPVPDAAFDPPAPCDHWIVLPSPEPVHRFVSAASVAELLTAAVPAAPVMATSVAGTYIPRPALLRPSLQAEPVMAGVWPRIADTPLEQIGGLLQLHLPQFATPMVPVTAFAPAAAAVGPAAQPVETLWVASSTAKPASGGIRVVHIPEIAALGAVVPAPVAGGPLTTPPPEALEKLLVASSAVPIVEAARVRLQPFTMFGTEDRAIPGIEQPRIAARVAEPAPIAAVPPVLEPIATLRLSVPEPRNSRPVAAVPRPGHVALQYHTQRTRSNACSRMEWKSARFEPLAPRFLLRPVLDRFEDLVKPKNAQPAPVFRMPEPRKMRSAIAEHALRIAAAIIVVTTIWFTAAAIKSGGRINVRPADPSFTASNPMLPANAQPRAAQPEEPKGPLAWVRKGLANRATLQVADDFQRGMQSWSTSAKGSPTGWERHKDGYMRTGLLALFTPTKTFTDYRLEFFSQIESKSMGWAVRARDQNNYHAMKFSVLEAGLRPIIAIVHYNVIDGKAGRLVQTPLNVMVHNNQPIQVAVNVRGNRMITSVDGEEVDTFINDVLPSGGVGFFSDAGERARLYWAKVTRNDDWLGHVCAFLSGGEGRATAEVWPPAIPGGPTPWSPAGEHSALAAAWMGLPYCRRNSTRRLKQCNS
jgi:hypothetical protein